MILSQFACGLLALAVLGVSQASGGCTEEISACSKEMLALSAGGDMSVMCKKKKEDILACLKGIAGCPDFLQKKVDTYINKLESDSSCKGTDPGGAGENIKPSYMLVLAAAILLAVRVHF